MNLTIEQQHVIDSVIDSKDNRIVAVNSVAGSGKSSTAKALVEVYKPNNGFLTAFNKAIIEDTKKKMNGMINCSTIHALAYKHVKPNRKIEELNYLTVTENISYDDKATIITTLDDFFRSSSSDIEEYAASKTHEPELQNLIVDYANRMLDGYIPPTFNYLLKVLHLMLVNKQIEIDFDLLILDECQDTTSVALEIFKLVNAKNKVMFGDRYQNIYSFMNTVNAFEELEDLNLLKLTQSFRCNPEVADIVENYGMDYLESTFEFKGNEDVVKSSTDKVAFISRTNSTLIERMDDLLSKGQSFYLTRNISEIFALPMALLNASRGKPVFDKKYKFLEKEYKNYLVSRNNYKSYFEYIVNITEDSSVENTAKVLMNFANKKINIYDIKEKVTNLKPNKNVILTTAHAFKGLEMDTVFIENDLNNSVGRVIDKIRIAEGISLKLNDYSTRDYLSKSDKEDLNTYYVALSRAKTKLINNDY